MHKKILLIDDDEDEQFFFMEALKEIKANVKFFFASGGKEGIQMFNYLLPDIVFIDINMPVMNGFEFLEMIIQNEKNKQPNTVIYSTSIDNKICKTAMEKNVITCIKKQGSIHDLAKILKTLLA